MLFSEPFFVLIFLPFVVALFYSSARIGGAQAGLTVLFLASCVFYANWGWFFFALMMAGTIINFAICGALVRLGPEREGTRKALLVLGQVYNFGTLIYFKYLAFYFLSEELSREGLRAAAIPIGISFYTFQQAVLLVDAYGRSEAVVRYLGDLSDLAGKVRAFFRYGAFHCFFPQLVIGPITYMSEFAPQVLGRGFGRPFRRNLEVGLTLIIIGLFKKVVIADSLAAVVDPAFAAMRDGASLSHAQAWAAALAFYTQLYFDFSGYTDMALGVARLFGLRLPINFDSPLRANGIVDFYRRWHITLTRVIGRFLFTPLSLWGTRFVAERGIGGWPRKLLSTWLPLLVNFEVIALWHGALPTYIIFGLVHGLWFVAETEVKTTKAWRRLKSAMSARALRLVGQAATFLPLMLTFALFRSDTLGSFSGLVTSMFGAPHPTHPGVNAGEGDSWLLIAGAFVVVWFLPNSMELTRRYRPGIATWLNPSTTPANAQFTWRPNPAWATVMGVLFCVSLYYVGREVPFIYMGF
jgi:alginate O-acetyltransferase complex protein AlgI